MDHHEHLKIGPAGRCLAVLQGHRLSAELKLDASDAVVDLLLAVVADGLPKAEGRPAQGDAQLARNARLNHYQKIETIINHYIVIAISGLFYSIFRLTSNPVPWPRRFMVFSWERISRPSSRLLPTAFSMSSFLAFAELTMDMNLILVGGIATPLKISLGIILPNIRKNKKMFQTTKQCFLFPNCLTTLSNSIMNHSCSCRLFSRKPTAIHRPTCSSSILPESSSNCARSSAWETLGKDIILICSYHVLQIFR